MQFTRTDKEVDTPWDGLGVTEQEYKSALDKAVAILNNESVTSVSETIMILAEKLTKEELAIAIVGTHYTALRNLSSIREHVDHVFNALSMIPKQEPLVTAIEDEPTNVVDFPGVVEQELPGFNSISTDGIPTDQQ